MTQEAQSRCNFFMWTLQWLSRTHPSTSPPQIFSLLKMCINEETSSCGKMCGAHGPNVSSSLCNKSSACIYRLFVELLHLYVFTCILCVRAASSYCEEWLYPLTVFPPGRLTSLRGCYAQETPGGGGTLKVLPSRQQVTPSTFTDESLTSSPLCLMLLLEAFCCCAQDQTWRFRIHFCGVKTCKALCVWPC